MRLFALQLKQMQLPHHYNKVVRINKRLSCQGWHFSSMHVIVSGFLFPIFTLQSCLLFHKSFLLLTSLLPSSPCSSIRLLYWSHLRIILFNLVSRRRRLSWQIHYWLAITRTYLWHTHTHTTTRCEHNREENGNSWVWVRKDTLSLCCEQCVCHCISRFSLVQKKNVI